MVQREEEDPIEERDGRGKRQKVESKERERKEKEEVSDQDRLEMAGGTSMLIRDDRSSLPNHSSK